MKQNRKFALSTIALLIQSVVAMQANAEAREISVDKTTDYIGLITNDEEKE
ncbi:hypothetical protein [Neisseria blantyrii]|uniref:hypothetical protein n=1 Tax=Neisseria blantyrii TaxID=2830647 RepID=UPI002729900A|nr:hypothetical protein [Neisseria blantyrii]